MRQLPLPGKINLRLIVDFVSLTMLRPSIAQSDESLDGIVTVLYSSRHFVDRQQRLPNRLSGLQNTIDASLFLWSRKYGPIWAEFVYSTFQWNFEVDLFHHTPLPKMSPASPGGLGVGQTNLFHLCNFYCNIQRIFIGLWPLSTINGDLCFICRLWNTDFHKFICRDLSSTFAGHELVVVVVVWSCQEQADVKTTITAQPHWPLFWRSTSYFLFYLFYRLGSQNVVSIWLVTKHWIYLT